MYLSSLAELIRHYLTVWQAAWKQRHAMAPPARTSHELAFLPAHLELQESPVHPAPQWAMRLIVLLLILALLWATLGQLDIVAVASGKIVPNGRVKVIQPLEAGVVKAIHVREGQSVQAGELLVELDSTLTTADLAKATEARQNAALTMARTAAVLQALDRGGEVSLANTQGLGPELLRAETQLARAQVAEYQSKTAALQAELAKRKAELQTSAEVIAKLEQLLPISEERAADFKRLQEQNFVSRHGYLDQKKEFMNLEKDLSAQRSRGQELVASIRAQEAQLRSSTAEFRRQLMDAQYQARQQFAQFDEDRTKADQRQALTRLTAPVSGRVQQLTVHTLGGVVNAAQSLLVIVPDETLEVEAMVENRDIGFVSPGQPVTIKVESFPYTRYGYLAGRVQTISTDAINDEKRGFLYSAKIKLDSDTFMVDGKQTRLTPGMVVSAEVKTGRRTVIDYFLSPLTENLSEGLRER